MTASATETASETVPKTTLADLLDLLRRARELLTPEDPMHPVGCSSWEEAAWVLADEIDATIA